MDYLYVNVNEEGEPYQFTSNADAALATLAEFPNDSIVVVVKGSPHANDLLRQQS